MSGQIAVAGSQIAFTDREADLDQIIHNVGGQGENRLMVLIAVPTMGKSMFLAQLPEKKKRYGLGHKQVYVDLANKQSLVRSELSALLQRIFSGADWGRDANAFSKVGTDAIGQSQKPWLVLLDNADLLTLHTANGLRQVLSGALQARRAFGRLVREDQELAASLDAIALTPVTLLKLV